MKSNLKNRKTCAIKDFELASLGEVVEFESVRFLLPIFSFHMERLLLFEYGCSRYVKCLFTNIVYSNGSFTCCSTSRVTTYSFIGKLLHEMTLKLYYVCTTTIKSFTWTFSSSSLTPKWNVKSSMWYFLYLLIAGVVGASCCFCSLPIFPVDRKPKILWIRYTALLSLYPMQLGWWTL